jgi:hypothetical protein
VTVVRLLIAAALLPVPIGVGPRYHPAPGTHGTCRRASLAEGRRVHLEIFALRRVVIVPAAIGVRKPRLRFGRVVGAYCRATIWSTDASGVVRFTGKAHLGDVFRVWGRPLGDGRLLGFRGRVRVYRNGRRVAADPRLVPLVDRAELVLEVGGYVPPHPGFRFPR